MYSTRSAVGSLIVLVVCGAVSAGDLANLPGVDFKPGALRLPLTAHERSGVGRVGVVVSSGVPFPPGFLEDEKTLRVLDGAGKPVPCQATVLTRWWKPTYDDSVRWALVSFVATVGPNGKADYTLTDAGGEVPGTPLAVEKGDAAVSVKTGALTVVIPTSGPAIVSRASVGDTVVLGGSGLRALLTGGDWPDQGMKAGVVHTSDVKKIVVEEGGPVRVVVLVEGTHASADPGGAKGGLYDFECRLYFTAGSSAVRIVHTLKNSRLVSHNDGKAVSRNLYVWPFTDYSLVGDLVLKGAASAMALGDKPIDAGAGGKGPLKVYQDSSGGDEWRDFNPKRLNYTRWLSPWTKGKTVRGVTFRGYKVTLGDQEIAAGNHAPGAAALGTDQAGVAVAFRDFWQQYPKAIELDASRLRIGLWPDEFDDVFFLEPGQRKSYDLVLDFGAAARSAEGLKRLSDAHDRTLLFRCPPAWYVKSGAWDAGLALIDEPGKSWADRWDKDKLDGIDVGWDWYSWISNWDSGGGHWNQNTQFARWALFADGQAFDVAEAKSLWAADLTPMHYDDPDMTQFWLMLRSWNLRENRIKRHTFPGYYHRAVWGVPDSGHMGMLIWPEYYYLTGDARARKALDSLGIRARAFLWQYNHDDRADGLGPLPGAINWCKRQDPDDPAFRLYNRYIGWPLYDLSLWYQLTGNRDLVPECLRVAHAFRNTGRWSPTGFLCGYINKPGDVSMYGGQTHHGRPPKTKSASQLYAHFQMGIMASGLVEYYRETHDEEALDTLVGFADFMCHHAMLRDESGKRRGWTYVFGDYWGPYAMSEIGASGKYVSFMSSNFRVTQPLGHIYRFTGREDYLDVLKDAVASLRSPSTGVIAAHQAVLHPHVDRKAPAAVADLKAEVAGDAVTLTWTAPGDDGRTGTAKRYQIKYAPVRMVERVSGWPDRTPPLPKDKVEWEARVKAFQAKQIAFWQAANCKDEPAPQEAGAKETFTVNDLTPGTWWFALKTFDDGPNMSDLSNVVSVTVE